MTHPIPAVALPTFVPARGVDDTDDQKALPYNIGFESLSQRDDYLFTLGLYVTRVGIAAADITMALDSVAPFSTGQHYKVVEVVSTGAPGGAPCLISAPTPNADGDTLELRIDRWNGKRLLLDAGTGPTKFFVVDSDIVTAGAYKFRWVAATGNWIFERSEVFQASQGFPRLTVPRYFDPVTVSLAVASGTNAVSTQTYNITSEGSVLEVDFVFVSSRNTAAGGANDNPMVWRFYVQRSDTAALIADDTYELPTEEGLVTCPRGAPTYTIAGKVFTAPILNVPAGGLTLTLTVRLAGGSEAAVIATRSYVGKYRAVVRPGF